jgi:hydrogenase maturation protein HypF
MTIAKSIRVRGVVQGVGFRPFVYRLARANSLAGWVLNEEDGIDIHLEGAAPAVDAFLSDLASQPPPAARILSIDVEPSQTAGISGFTIRESERRGPPSVAISPDLPICEACRAELFDPANPRYLYPYINCTDCGPRYSVVESLPYDRANTTMKSWPLDAFCRTQFYNPSDRRFHAQPVACPGCGPHYHLECARQERSNDAAAIQAAALLLCEGRILAVKGIGGYHLACDAQNPNAVGALRERKFRKEKPFALMVANLAAARSIAHLSSDAAALLTSPARPIVLVPRRVSLPGVAPENHELGLMLPYAPLHYLLFAAGAPGLLVMTSANRSSEPIAYRDDDARATLSGLADVFLIGERPIARRIDDSVARSSVFGPVILRRSRGFAPAAVTAIPSSRPILALGADLKNAVTLVVDGQAFVSQHIGDLDHYESLEAFRATIEDLLSMYGVDRSALLVAHDAHPQYASSLHAFDLPAAARISVQHHRAHIASVIAERQAWDKPVLGVSFDGTGFGDDGAIWGGEFFTGSIASGFTRALHLRPARLPGGDAAARRPVQCAAGFLSQLSSNVDFTQSPFHFASPYSASLELLRKRVRIFETTSMGRLFDTAAALLGFTREITFEGQAAMWLEHIARQSSTARTYPFPLAGNQLDWRPLLEAIIEDRRIGRSRTEIARAFHASVAQAVCRAALAVLETQSLDTLVVSGGVFQNELLLAELMARLDSTPISVWTNSAVPPNDGGISLGQAALAAFHA